MISQSFVAYNKQNHVDCLAQLSPVSHEGRRETWFLLIILGVTWDE